MTFYFIIAPLLGAIVGAIISGKVMNKGRRLPKMIFDIIGIIGCIMFLFNSYVIMIVGNTLFGLAVGGLITLTPRIIEETIPV